MKKTEAIYETAKEKKGKSPLLGMLLLVIGLMVLTACSSGDAAKETGELQQTAQVSVEDNAVMQGDDAMVEEQDTQTGQQSPSEAQNAADAANRTTSAAGDVPSQQTKIAGVGAVAQAKDKAISKPVPQAADSNPEQAAPQHESQLPQKQELQHDEDASVSNQITAIQIQINEKTFTATLAETEAAKALVEQLPLTISMSDYGGFEKVGAIGATLPTENRDMTTIAGDIVLYNGNQLVLFYGSNNWSYTPLAHVEDLTGWFDALGYGGITATITVK